MEEFMDLIAADESPAEISDAIKDMLYTKAMEKIDQQRPIVSASLFTTTEEE